MKIIAVILSFALMACASELDVNVELEEYEFIESIVHSAVSASERYAMQTVRLVEHEVHEIVMYPVQQLEQAVADIESRKQESEACVNAEAVHTASTVETATVDFYGCGHDAIENSIETVLDTKRAVLQLTFDGYALSKQALHCRQVKGLSKRLCRAKLGVMGGLYVFNAKKSISTLIHLRQRAPGIAADAQSCTLQATEHAMTEFGLINENIDRCIYNTIH